MCSTICVGRWRERNKVYGLRSAVFGQIAQQRYYCILTEDRRPYSLNCHFTSMSDQSRKLRFATRAIHAGQAPDPSTGAVMPPIYTTSTYAQSSPGVHKGYDYSRTRNPTRGAWERCIADLEGGTRGFAFASGMAATSTVMELLDAGSHVVAMEDLYGGTFRLFERVRRRSAAHTYSFVDLSNMASLEAAVRPETRMIWIETP